MRRSVRTFIEFIVAIVAVIALAMGVLILRLGSSPINSTFLTPYIEAGIERYIPDAKAQINHTLLTWDNVDHSMTLRAEGMVIRNGEADTIAEIPNLDIRLSLFGFLVGQFWPIELTIDHPQFRLIRHPDGRLYFASMATADHTADQGLDQADNSRDVLKQSLSNLTHAYAMRHLMVFHAAIAVHDEESGRDWSVSVPEISLVRNFAQLLGTVKIDLTQKEQVATLELHYDYDHLKHLHRVSTRFQDITPAQLVGGHPETLGLSDAAMFDLPLSGEMEMAFDSDLQIAAAAANLHGAAGTLHAPGLWLKPRPISGFDIEADYDRKAKSFNLGTASIDFGGPKLMLTASGHPPRNAKKFDHDFTLKATLENVPMDSFADIWPDPIIPNARSWMARSLSQGTYDKGEGTFDGSLSWADLADIDVASGQGKVTASNGTVTYIPGMPPVKGVNVTADFDLQKMNLALSGGSIGDLRMKPFTAVITGLSDNDQFIDIPMQLKGPVPDIIRLIDHPPLQFASAVGLTPDTLTGMAEGTVSLHFPLLNNLAMRDIDVNATAALTNIATSKLIKGVTVTDGDLTLNLDKDSLKIKGTAAVQKVPFQLAVQQFFHPEDTAPLRQLDVTGLIKNDQWKMLGDNFAGSTGIANVSMQATQYKDARSVFSGTFDFGAADFHFAPLNWRKPLNQPATLQFDGEAVAGKDITLKSLSLRSPQAYAQGKAVVTADGSVKSISLEPLRLGRTSANIRFSQGAGDKGMMRFDVSGKALDIAGIKGGNDPAHADARPTEYHINVDKLLTSDTGVIDKAEGFAIRDSIGWKAISLHGLADGEHKLAVELTPQTDGTSDFSITCDDFGKMLKGLGFTDTVKEGDVDIKGASTLEAPRVITGTARIGSFSVGKLPVLALLLNATSPFGFSGLVTDSASFEHMNGAYRWSGDEVELEHMNAAGSSVGMNIAGKIDMNSGRANLHGTLVPFSMVNRILGSIPLLGDILTGGDGGGVLAVSYGIKGSLAKPDVSVNPVSLLTPGFLRNLFFGSGDDDIEVPPEKPAKP